MIFLEFLAEYKSKPSQEKLVTRSLFDQDRLVTSEFIPTDPHSDATTTSESSTSGRAKRAASSSAAKNISEKTKDEEEDENDAGEKKDTEGCMFSFLTCC